MQNNTKEKKAKDMQGAKKRKTMVTKQTNKQFIRAKTKTISANIK